MKNVDTVRRTVNPYRVGRNFEYRLRGALQRLGWTAERVPLSGCSHLLTGDVVAEKDGVRVKIEAKKTGRKCLTLKSEWFENLEPGDYIAFAFARTPVFVAVTLDEWNAMIDLKRREGYD